MAEIQKIDVIKYEGDNTTFIWKHPLEDFYSLTQLIVHESQEAIFFMNGQALDLFTAGRYTLETQSLPKLSKFLKRQIGDRTPFHSEVYFINKTEQMSIRWGTDTKVQYIEPTYKFPINFGASGEMSLRCEDSRKLLVKLVGTERELTQPKLVNYFRAFLMTRVKSYISNFMTENKINIFEVDRYLTEFSDVLKHLLTPDFDTYGLVLEQFLVTAISRPEGDRQYEKFRELYFRKYSEIQEAKIKQEVELINQETASKKIVLQAQAIAEKRKLEGYTYQQERGFDVAEQVAKNDAVAQFTTLGMGLGTMTGTGAVLGGMVGGMLGDAIKETAIGNPQRQPQKKSCPKCGNILSDSVKFCPDCGVLITEQGEEKIICPFCNKPTKKSKFCSECGKLLTLKCPECGAALSPGTHFCSECGKKL